ncbi:MAG: sugar ABC transporter permease [Clostridia bacterium]|nr:sugar ABC transporter permease [Clostridia bacterium]
MLNRDSLDFYKLNGLQKVFYKFLWFITAVPKTALNILKKAFYSVRDFVFKTFSVIRNIVRIFRDGDIYTRISYFIMGFGQFFRKQPLRGILFLAFQLVFILYMLLFGISYLGKLDDLGEVAAVTVINEYGLEVIEYKDNSLQILLYGVLTLFFCLGFIYTWYVNVKQNGVAQTLINKGKLPKNAAEDVRSLADEQYHKTLLALPLAGILIFTVIPLVFMVLVAFTNYDYTHLPPSKLFTWVGLDNFKSLLGVQVADGKFAFTFGEILIWTLIWAFFATFTNYFLGILVAMLINKKGIKFKKVFRTLLIFTIAVPQFVSLLLISKMLANDGAVNGILLQIGVIKENIKWLTDPILARITVILVNIWLGIPYTMLIATGILINIPADLYESARIDGASGIKRFTKITMPYMLFVTGPYLLTTFVGNINNFNVIYLLTGGAPKTTDFTGGAGYTDLLITWLYKLTLTDNDYKMAAVIGIMTFVVVAGISLVVYNLSSSVKNEESFQ